MRTFVPRTLVRAFTTWAPRRSTKLTLGGGINWQSASHTFVGTPDGAVVFRARRRDADQPDGALPVHAERLGAVQRQQPARPRSTSCSTTTTTRTTASRRTTRVSELQVLMGRAASATAEDGPRCLARGASIAAGVASQASMKGHDQRRRGQRHHPDQERHGDVIRGQAQRQRQRDGGRAQHAQRPARAPRLRRPVTCCQCGSLASASQPMPRDWRAAPSTTASL